MLACIINYDDFGNNGVITGLKYILKELARWLW